MSRPRPTANVGLFADGLVGEGVLSILVERCRDRLGYVVVPAADSIVARKATELSPETPLLCWADHAKSASLPRHMGQLPDVVILAWWPFVVRPPFLSAGQSATLNMHPSLLPFGRGKDPNFWALADSEPFGVTIHHVAEGVDTGDIAFQTPLAVGWEDTGATLYQRAQDALLNLFSASLDAVLGLAIPRIPQAVDRGSAHRRTQLETRSMISLDDTSTIRDVLNVLRARTFPPHPACRFVDEDVMYQVRVEIEKVTD